MRKQKDVFVDLSDLPKYEKGDQKTTEKRRQEYQKKYQTEYQKTAKKIQIRVMAYQLNSTKIKMISKSGLKYLDQVRSELQRIAKYAKS
jgi:predicted DNA binding CopG/RHH family protein